MAGSGNSANNSVISSKAFSGPGLTGHPQDIQKIINFLSDDRPLSIMEYDKMIKYLVSKRTETLKEEYGDNIPAHLQHPPVGPQQDPITKAKQEEMQNRIQKILKDKSRNSNPSMAPSLQAAIDSLVKNGPNLLSGMSQRDPQPSSSYSFGSSSNQYQQNPTSSSYNTQSYQSSHSQNQGYSSGTGGFGGGFSNY